MSTLLSLADQRLPTGGHVHSGGIEQAVGDGRVTDEATLASFLARRLQTSALVHAALTATAWGVDAGAVDALADEVDARIVSAPLRTASRAQGRGLLRTARAAWAAPHSALSWADLGNRPHHAIALGAASRAGRVDRHGAALIAAYGAVTGPASAAQRLLALDPVGVAALTIGLGPDIDACASAAVAAAAGPWADLPAMSDPLLDALAARHAGRDARLFAS